MQTYDPNQVNVTFGAHIVTGFASDTMITISPTNDKYITEMDAHGSAIRVKQNGNNYEITITLTQMSPSNNIFSIATNAGNAGTSPFALRVGDTVFTSAFTYVQRVSDITYGTNLSNREWTLLATEAQYFLAGVDPDA